MSHHKKEQKTEGKRGLNCSPVYQSLTVHLFTDLPGQIHVKHHGTHAVVTWTPDYKPKCFVVDWGTGKEDMHMKVITTATGNFTLGNSN